MSRSLLICILTFLSFSVYSQSTLPDNFKIGNSLEVYNRDSLRIYFNCQGSIVDKKCASFYRVGRMDPATVNFTGEFQDFDTDGNLYFKATMTVNGIEGYAAYYFKNGKISEEGNFKDNLRTGIWKYYYPNGQIEKIYSYDSIEPLVLEAYDKKGTATVVNGNGKIQTEFRNYRQCNNFKTWGNLVNGKKDGKWAFSNVHASPIGTETFQEGVFINGKSNSYEYTENPSIKLTKYYPNEYLSLVENSPDCLAYGRIRLLQYDGEPWSETFYPRLQEDLNSNKANVKNQWIVVGIEISKENKVEEINVASSINDTDLENRIYGTIKKMNNWEAAVVNAKPVDSKIYFSILVDNNQVVILPDYIRKNRQSLN